MLNIVQPTAPHHHPLSHTTSTTSSKMSDSSSSTSTNNNNFDLKSYFQQLAVANGVKGFSLVSDNALCPRYDMKRISAPPVMNGATRKFLSMDDDAAPSYPSRRRSSGVESMQRGSLMRWEEHNHQKGGSDATSMNNLHNNCRRYSEGDDRQSSNHHNNNNHKNHQNASMLETVFDQVDSILYEEEEEEDDHSVDSQEVVTQCLQQNGADDSGDPRFDSSFRRFSLTSGNMDKAPIAVKTTSSLRPSVAARHQVAGDRPILPVRQMSVDDFSKDSKDVTTGTLSSGDSVVSVVSSASSVSVSIATNDIHANVPSSPTGGTMKASFAVCVPIEETTSWHEDDEDDNDNEVLEEEEYNDQTKEAPSKHANAVPPPPPMALNTPDPQPWESKVSPTIVQQHPASAPTVKRAIALDNVEDMLEPPPLDDPSPAASLKYRRRRRSSRRSSLDTGFTFRNSFSSQTSEDGEENGGIDKEAPSPPKSSPKTPSSRWD